MEASQTDASGISRPGRFNSVLAFLFCAYLMAASAMFTNLTDVNEPKWFLVRAVAPALLAAAVLRDLTNGRRLRPLGPLGVLALAFLAWHAVSCFVAINPGRALMRTSDIAGLVCTYFLAARITSAPRYRNAVCWTLLAIGGAASAYGVAQHFGRDFFPWDENPEVLVSRGVTFYGHATFAASVLIQILPLGLALFAASPRWLARAAIALPLGLMLYHLSFSGARTATLSFLLSTGGAAVWWLRQTRRSRPAGAPRLSRWRVVAATLAVMLLAALFAGFLIIRAWQAKGSDAFAIRQASLALRIYNWETASRIIFAHPVLGIGADNYEIASPAYWNPVEQVRTARYSRWMQQAHNEYLQTAAELGLPGIALLFSIFAYGLVMALGVAARARGAGDRLLGLGLAAGVAAIGMDAITTFSLQAPGSALVFWTLLGLIAAFHRIGRSGQTRAIAGTETARGGSGFRKQAPSPR